MNPPEQHGSASEPLESFLKCASEAENLAYQLLTGFNARRVYLKDIPPQKRIFLFFFTRALKTYSAIQTLSREGFGQDTAALIRGLLESLISARYILADPKTASQRAVRFVEYKWIIFRRYLPDESEDVAQITDTLRKELINKKALILDKIKEFKAKYKITSDRALITWSGRSLRDMARMVDRTLVQEYDSTFRLSSRFSHPSIIGDSEYLNQKGETLTFYPSPSNIGVLHNLKITTRYLLEFMGLFNSMFGLELSDKIAQFQTDFEITMTSSEPTTTSHDSSSDTPKTKARETIIQFQIPPLKD